MNPIPSRPTSVAPAKTFRIVGRRTSLVVGGVAAVSALAATLMLFGPFSDMSAAQLAAGPDAMVSDQVIAPIVMAPTGRSWGAAAHRRQASASSPADRPLAMRVEPRRP